MTAFRCKPIIVTTSWDDDHCLDVRLAEILDEYRLPGTFYIAPASAELAFWQGGRCRGSSVDSQLRSITGLRPFSRTAHVDDPAMLGAKLPVLAEIYRSALGVRDDGQPDAAVTS